MHVLVVHAHHETASFCSALFRQAVEAFADQGHEVDTSDLYADRFDPVSDRRNFTSVFNADYLKQQFEERHASDVGGFEPRLEQEIRKLERCDLLVFNFPLWWFAMPAILKGWVDRVFAMRRIYGDGKLYENGLGRATRRAMVIVTTGGGPDAYGGYGVNPSLESVLTPIQHGIFWFNGFLPLDPFVAWSAARTTPETREKYLHDLRTRLQRLDQETPRRLPPLNDFPAFGKDQKKRFMVTLSGNGLMQGQSPGLTPTEMREIERLKRDGIVLSSHFGSADAGRWRAFLVVRESTAERVREVVGSMQIASRVDYDVTELSEPAPA
jgi:NAD(P)H dehydrogenase (quinone)